MSPVRFRAQPPSESADNQPLTHGTASGAAKNVAQVAADLWFSSGTSADAEGARTRERQERGAWHVLCVVVMPSEVTAFPWNEVRNGCYKHHKIGWMTNVPGFQWYDDFKENLGPRWAYYLFPLLDREDWDEARDAVWVTACLLRDGFWKHARWLSNLIACGANIEEATAVRPTMEPVIQSYLETGPLSSSL